MRCRLYPTPEQERGLFEHCAHARFVWNLALEQHNLYRPQWGPTPNYAQQSRQLTEARRSSWLGEGSSTVQGQALRDLDQAFRVWWRGTRRRPNWRKKGVHEGFRVHDSQGLYAPRRLNRKWGSVLVPKIGRVKFRWTRDLGIPKSYRVKRDAAGNWWVAFPGIPAPIEAPGNGAVVGLDRGVTISVATSDGALHNAPRIVHPRRLRLERRLARARMGSHRRIRARCALAKVRAQEADRRKDWIEKLSTDLARSYDVIRVEDLRIVNMMRGRNRGLHRGIAESGWGELVRRLEDKAPGRVEKVDPRYTSQQCSVCGHIARENRESQAVFRCVACGHTDNADVNAARNIAARHAVTARGGSAVELVNREPPNPPRRGTPTVPMRETP